MRRNCNCNGNVKNKPCCLTAAPTTKKTTTKTTRSSTAGSVQTSSSIDTGNITIDTTEPLTLSTATKTVNTTTQTVNTTGAANTTTEARPPTTLSTVLETETKEVTETDSVSTDTAYQPRPASSNEFNSTTASMSTSTETVADPHAYVTSQSITLDTNQSTHGGIIGGVIGGLALAIVVAVVAVMCIRRRRRANRKKTSDERDMNCNYVENQNGQIYDEPADIYTVNNRSQNTSTKCGEINDKNASYSVQDAAVTPLYSLANLPSKNGGSSSAISDSGNNDNSNYFVIEETDSPQYLLANSPPKQTETCFMLSDAVNDSSYELAKVNPQQGGNNANPLLEGDYETAYPFDTPGSVAIATDLRGVRNSEFDKTVRADVETLWDQYGYSHMADLERAPKTRDSTYDHASMNSNNTDHYGYTQAQRSLQNVIFLDTPTTETNGAAVSEYSICEDSTKAETTQ